MSKTRIGSEPHRSRMCCKVKFIVKFPYMSTTDVAALSQTIFSQFIIFLIVFDMLEFVAAEFECWNNLLWYFNAFHIVIRESMSRSDHFGVCC